MKKITILLLAIMLSGLVALEAQPPRLRTSAPAELTAQKGKSKAAKAETKAATTKAATPAASASKTTVSASDLYMAFKTNLAYDAFGVLNFAYECQFASHWTAELPITWSLWDWSDDKGLRTVAIQPGVKYWFKNPGTGHALGVDLDLVWFNARRNAKRYQVDGRPAAGASLVYAYTLNLGRNWKAEFSLGVGYVNARYNTYYNITDGALIDTRTKHYFGPTRIGITLAYSL